MKAIACLTLALGVAVITVLLYILNGWVMSVLWGWFVVPYFDAPILSIPVFIGISLLVGMLTHSSTYIEAKDETEKIGRIVMPIFYPFLVLIIGSIVHLFI